LFLSKDIENLFKDEVFNRPLDCTDLHHYFEERMSNDESLQFKIHVNCDGELDMIFFVVNREAFNIWAETEGSVLLFDTKHGTNRYGLKLGLLSCIDANCRTQVLAASFVESEDTQSFSWVFDQFAGVFGSAPKAIFTDSDKSMEVAISTTWKTSTHLLCTFHIWKNFYDHIRRIVVDQSHWNIIANRWWRLCKESDSTMQVEFDSEWAALVELIKTHSSVDAFATQEAWLRSMNDRKMKWAACFTWSHCTFGIHSTARAEALHSAVNQFCSKQSTAVEIVKDIEAMCNGQQQRTLVEAEHTNMFSSFNDVIGRSSSAQLTPLYLTILASVVVCNFASRDVGHVANTFVPF
jgi:hypothetical protein